MIVITRKYETPRYVRRGDIFNLTIKDGMEYEVVIRETITVDRAIDFIASFRFALDDGTCPGFHLMGVFACKSELPEELKNAVMLEDLTKEQRRNFEKTVGVELQKKKTWLMKN
jgi:hypothetical protein